MDFDAGAGNAVYADGYAEAEGRPQLAVNTETGMVELHHWGHAGLGSIDPTFACETPIVQQDTPLTFSNPVRNSTSLRHPRFCAIYFKNIALQRWV